MTKIQLIQTINQMLQNAGVDHGFLKYHNRSKATFEGLIQQTKLLVDIKNAHDVLENAYSIVEIGLASIDGTDDPALQQILRYKEQMTDIIELLDLGAAY